MAIAMNSDIKRKKWMREGLIGASSVSFWGPYTGTSSKNIIYQVNNEGAGDGHTVVFDFSGKLTGKAIKGQDTAYGKGEIKRKFSDKITVERYRIPVGNGDKFDGVDIGDLEINAHSDSRSKLSDLFIRWKDQMLFDTAQGALGSTPSHIYDLGATFEYDDLGKIERALKTGKGFKAGSATGALTTVDAKRRAPLEPFQLKGGEPVWLFLVDSYMAIKIKQSSDYKNIVMTGDVRGNNNRLITGVIGKLGKLLIVEAPEFFGATAGSGAFGLSDSEVEFAGLRAYSTPGTITTTTALSNWEGQAEFDTDAETVGKIMSRGLILGQGAIQNAFGKMPDYKWQESTDFGITSQSAVEYWTDAKKSNLKLEKGKEFKSAKITDLDFAVIAVDLKHA